MDDEMNVTDNGKEQEKSVNGSGAKDEQERTFTQEEVNQIIQKVAPRKGRVSRNENIANLGYKRGWLRDADIRLLQRTQENLIRVYADIQVLGGSCDTSLFDEV